MVSDMYCNSIFFFGDGGFGEEFFVTACADGWPGTLACSKWQNSFGLPPGQLLLPSDCVEFAADNLADIWVWAISP